MFLKTLTLKGFKSFADTTSLDLEPGVTVVVGDVDVYDEAGTLVSKTRGARLWYLDSASGNDFLGAPDGWYYQVRWQPQDLKGAPNARAGRRSRG